MKKHLRIELIHARGSNTHIGNALKVGVMNEICGGKMVQLSENCNEV